MAPAWVMPTLRMTTGLIGGRFLGDAQELVAFLDALQVSGDDVGLFVLGQRLDEIHFVEIGFVAEADDLAQAELLVRCPIEDGHAERPRLRNDGDMPGGGREGAKVAFIRWSVLSTPRQLGPTIRTPLAWQSSTSSCSASAPLALTSRNPAVMTMTDLAPALIALWTASLTCFAGHHHDPEINLPFVRRQRPVAWQPQDLAGFGVDRDDGAFEAAVESSWRARRARPSPDCAKRR